MAAPLPNLNPATNKEPVLTVASFVALVSAAIAVAVSFGLHLSADQITKILAFVSIAAPFAVAFARKYVTPVAHPNLEK